MRRVVRSRQAKRDLVQIWVHVAEDSIRAADALIDLLDDKARMLAEWPTAGPARPELAPSLRSYPVGQYLIFYRPSKGGIEVVRVVHGHRNLRRVFKRGRKP